jgi:hypothetical protein
VDDFLSSVDPYPHDFIGQTLSFVMIKIEVTVAHEATRACKERVINWENEYNAKYKTHSCKLITFAPKRLLSSLLSSSASLSTSSSLTK